MSKTETIQTYIRSKLVNHPQLGNLLPQSSIVWYASAAFIEEIDEQVSRDLLILVPDHLNERFVEDCGQNFIIDDHDVKPPTFVRVKDLKWFQADFSRRLPIALWLYEHAVILQDPMGEFQYTLEEKKEIFTHSLPRLMQAKYVEFRSERHNLRDTARLQYCGMEEATILIKAVVAKLAAEIVFLAERKPYPYKKWLFWALGRETSCGGEVNDLVHCFLQEQDQHLIIEHSDRLVAKVSSIATKSGLLPSDVSEHWWCYLG